MNLVLLEIHVLMCRKVRHKSRHLRLPEFTGSDARGKCQWRLNSEGIFNKNSTAFDNALVIELYSLRVFSIPSSTLLNVCGLEEQERF